MVSALFTSRYLKYLGILLVVVGGPTLLLDKTHGSELPLLLGLFLIFISREKVEDERSYSIRVSSLTIGFILGYIFEFITSYFFNKGIINWHLTEIKHFIILVFAIAISLFYLRLYLLKE